MNKTGDSLSGQNKGRRAAGIGSSPVLPVYKKTVLWNRLRKLDRAIHLINKKLSFDGLIWRNKNPSDLVKLKMLDDKRKETRHKLKYGLTSS